MRNLHVTHYHNQDLLNGKRNHCFLLIFFFFLFFFFVFLQTPSFKIELPSLTNSFYLQHEWKSISACEG